jgi:hypothetical protein
VKVLITNAHLRHFAGSEVVVRDLALELQRQGHEPWVYSPVLGALGAGIRSAGVPVARDLADLPGVPDIIHGQHHRPALDALLFFPATPAIFSCLASKYLNEAPFYFPRFLRYVAIDEPCRRRMERVPNISPQRIEVILNAVDLARFTTRCHLPARPRRALVYSNYANGFTHLPAVRRACRRAGLRLDVVGAAHGNPTAHPETLLPRYDIVFAKASCALQAMAVGNAVILRDFPGAGPMVRLENMQVLRPMNFGAGTLTRRLEADALVEEIARYDAADEARVSEIIRAEAGLTPTVHRWLDLYRSVLEEFEASPQDFHQELRALRDYVAQWSYENRRVWEIEQLARLKSIPWAGRHLHYLATQLLRRHLALR